MQASTRPRPHPARADTAHTPMNATRNRPTGPAHAAAPAAGIPDVVGLKGVSGPATGIDRLCTESSAGARGASDEGRGSSSSISWCWLSLESSSLFCFFNRSHGPLTVTDPKGTNQSLRDVKIHVWKWSCALTSRLGAVLGRKGDDHDCGSRPDTFNTSCVKNGAIDL